MESVHEIITQLKFIGMIKKGEKMDVKNLCVYQNTLLSALWRMILNESKDKTLEFLISTIDKAFKIVTENLTEKKNINNTLCINIINDLINSMIGLSNLQVTYADNRYYWCHIQTLIQDIDVRLDELYETYPDIFPEDYRKIVIKELNSIPLNSKETTSSVSNFRESNSTSIKSSSENKKSTIVPSAPTIEKNKNESKFNM